MKSLRKRTAHMLRRAANRLDPPPQHHPFVYWNNVTSNATTYTIRPH